MHAICRNWCDLRESQERCSNECFRQPIVRIGTHFDIDGIQPVALATLIAAYAPHDGRIELRIPGAYAIRQSNVNCESMHGVQQSTFCIVALNEPRASLWERIAASMIRST